MGDEVDAFSEELRRRPEVRIINKYAVVLAHGRFFLKSIGALLLLWATVVLLGGFVSLMTKDDFWSVTIIAFVQAAGLVLSIQLFLNAIFFRFCYFLVPEIIQSVVHFFVVHSELAEEEVAPLPILGGP